MHEMQHVNCTQRIHGGERVSTAEVEPRREILSTKEVGAEYGFNQGTLRYWRCRDEGPASFRMGKKRVVYRRSEIERWIAAQEAASTRGGIAS